MFPLQFDIGIPGAKIEIRCIPGRRFGAYAVAFHGTRYDNRFVPAMTGAKGDWRVAVFAVEGALRVNGAVVPADSIMIAPQTVLTSTTASVNAAIHVSTTGHAGRVVAIRVLPDSLTERCQGVGTVVAISSASQNAFRALSGPTESGDVTEAIRIGTALIDSLIADGVATAPLHLAEEQASRSLAMRTFEAVFPLLSTLAKQPMMVDIVERAGIGERQVLRNILRVQDDFDLLDRGWRESIVRWRATAAVMLLSAPHLSLSEVATGAGYSSTKTMGRALSDAGLPQASAIREMLHQDNHAAV
jgi:AraC-like DNA-binding protein